MQIKTTLVILLTGVVAYVGAGNRQIFAIGGLSGTKLNALSADALAPGVAELETAFRSFRSRGTYNEFGHLKNTPGDYDRLAAGEQRTATSESGLAFRATGGFARNLELGAAFGHTNSEDSLNGPTPTSYDDFVVALKYCLTCDHAFKLAFQSGVSLKTGDWTPTGEAGLLATYNVTDEFSIDLDLSASMSGKRTIEAQRITERGAVARIGAGSLFFERLTIFVEGGYEQSYARRRRNLHLSREVARISNFNPDFLNRESSFESLRTETAPISLGGDAIIPIPLAQITESVRAWEKRGLGSAGLSYQISDAALFTLAYSQTFDGLNTGGGQEIIGIFTYQFASAAGADAE